MKPQKKNKQKLFLFCLLMAILSMQPFIRTPFNQTVMATSNTTVTMPDFKFNDSDYKFTIRDYSNLGKSKYLSVRNGSIITAYSTNEQVAKVNSYSNYSVTISSVGIGTCQIIAVDAYGTQAICNITVNYPNFALSNTIVDLSPSSRTYSFTADSGTIVSATSSSPDIVSVTQDKYYSARFHLTAHAYGNVIISCVDKYGQIATLKVHSTVKGNATNIKMDSKVTVKQSLTKKISVSLVYPDKELLTGLTWTTSNAKVAKVDANGVVTGVGKGTATITCKLTNGKAYKCTVTVPAKEAATKVSLPSKTSIYEFQRTKMKVTLTYPGYQTLTGIKWTSSNKKVATIDGKGYITGIKKGTTTITCTLSNGKTYKTKVTVKNNISLPTSLTVTTGFSKSVSVTAKADKSNALKGAKWTSSNKKIATVNSSGKITARSNGSCKITLKLRNGNTYTTKVKTRANTYKGISANSIYASNYRYGQLYLFVNSAKYSKNQLTLKAVILNNRVFKAKKFNYINLKVYNSKGTCIASKKFKNFKLNLSAYDTKVYTFTFNVKKKYDLASDALSLDYNYEWTYSIR